MEASTESTEVSGAERDNIDNCENNRTENSTRSALDELIQEDAKLKKLIEDAQESKQRKWRVRNTAIANSNWKLELEVKKLRDRTEHLQKEITVKSQESQKSRDDLETYRSRNKQEAVDFWTNFQEETQKYSTLFTNGHIEYSSDCLKQNIEEYRRESECVRGMIEKIEEEMEALKAEYGLAELGTNEQANLLADIDTAKKIISDKNLLVRATKSAESDIEVLKLKVKQKKDDIAYLQNKSCKK